MAGAADMVSVVAFGPIVDCGGAIVVDVGAGDSTSLVDALMARNRRSPICRSTSGCRP
jgi:hypothetical protein